MANGQDEPTADEVAGLAAASAALTKEAAADAPSGEAPKNPVVQQIMDYANVYRKGIKALAHGVLTFRHTTAALEAVPGGNHGEIVANITLAYRHLEDASSRLGKAIQAADGGVSVYDRETTVGA